MDKARQRFIESEIRGGFAYDPFLNYQVQARFDIFNEWAVSIKADAWDEGYSKGLSDGQRADDWCSINPYVEN